MPPNLKFNLSSSDAQIRDERNVPGGDTDFDLHVTPLDCTAVRGKLLPRLRVCTARFSAH